jgi:V/A-type H+/Na+-transporting ATPase subunit K
MRTISLLTGIAAAALPTLAFAQVPEAATTASTIINHWPLGLALLGVALATALACYGSAIGVSTVGQAGAGLLTEKPELAGKVITLAVLPGSQGLYGMVISLLFLFSFGTTVLNDEVTLSVADGLALFASFLPVAITCLTSAPYQGKVCAAGMHMLAKDGRLAGRVITMAALVETYALLGFLISFFMLNALKAGILTPAGA